MTTLAEFLLARIAEDETIARKARRTRIDCPTPEGTDWIERCGPGQTLIECETKRRIVDLHRVESSVDSVWHDRADGLRELVKASEYSCVICGWVMEEEAGSVFGAPGCDTLRVLALPYADHPDYRPEWRP